jgi:DNA polymerase-3 subunit epsilon
MQRWWWRRALEAGPLAACLGAGLPPVGRDYREVEFLALDLETTGLDPQADRIVSFGFVPIVGGRVRMAEARHHYVQIDGSVDQSATIHGIVDAHLDAGLALADALADALQALTGRVLLAHNAGFDRGFLSAACKRFWGAPLPVYAVDTLALAWRRRQRLERGIHEGELRLQALRDRYGLPRYGAHHALTDAIATAELFLAMAADRARSGRLPLGALL